MSKIDKDTRHRLLTTRLPALPQILLRLLELCRDEDSGLDDIAKLVGHEPALSARLLSLASAADRLGRQAPRNLTQALMQLGLDTVRTAVIGDAIQQVFNGLAGGRDVDLGHFWRHSLASAILAKRLARASDYPHVEEAYLAGLLHDVGKLAMLATFPAEYRRALAEDNDDDWLSRWEEDTLGFTHAEVGAWLAARWELDGFLADALLYHHEAAEQIAQAHPLVRIVWLAHNVAEGAEVPDLLGCGPEKLAGAATGLAEELTRAADFLGIRLADPDDRQRAQARLTEEVRGLALAGAMHAQPVRRPAVAVEQLRTTALTARTLFGLGDCLYYQTEGARLRALAPWPHLTRGEELGVAVGEAGGCVGRASDSGRIGSVRAAELAANLLDKQLLRLLGGNEGVPALLAIPVGRTRPAPVLVFAADQEVVAGLLGQAALLRAFADETAARLSEPAAATAAEPALRDQVRRAVHEANNPLGIIKNYLRILADDLRGRPDSGGLAEDLAMVNSEIERVGRILRQLARADDEAGDDIPALGTDLNLAVRELLAFCRDTHFIPPGIRVEPSLQDELPNVRAGRDNLKQILLNLLKNGIEALGKEGRITVSTSGQVPAEGGREVLLLVSDDGPGLPPEVQAGLFKPVETTKGAGHAGLGLAIVGELVERCGGRIECQSGPAGTAFTLHLPAMPAKGPSP